MHLHEAARRPKYYTPLIAEKNRLITSQGATDFDWLAGHSIESRTADGFKQYLRHAPLDAQQAVDWRKSLAELPPKAPLEVKVHHHLRYEILDAIVCLYRENAIGESAKLLPDENWPPRLVSAFEQADLNAALRRINRQYDQVVEAFKIDGYEQQIRAMQALADDQMVDADWILRQIGAADDKRHAAVEAFAVWVFGMMRRPLGAKLAAATRSNQQVVLIDTGLALAAYHGEQGRIPETLADLVPQYWPDVPRDLFSGKELIYRPTAKGYLLYSVGRNLKDDGGQERLPNGDDIVLKIER